MTTHDAPPAAGPLDLGAGIRVHPGILTPELVDAAAVTPHPRNPRRGDLDAIGESLDTNGLYDQIKVQRSTGFILSGNHTYKTLRAKGAERVPVVWLDVDDAEAVRVMASANRTADRGSYDGKLLVELLREDLAGDVTGTGYTTEELEALDAASRVVADGEALDLGQDALMVQLRALTDATPDEDDTALGPVYSRRADAIRYEPTSETPPPVSELVDTRKTDELLRAVREAAGAGRIPPDVATFLEYGAQRHLVFSYARIAEFYAHASPDVQELMEASALVIVDFEDAVQHGFVRLSDRLAELLDLDLAHRAMLDARKAAGGA